MECQKSSQAQLVCSPYVLCVVVLDALSEIVRKEESCELLCAYDLGVLANIEEELRRRVLER